MNAQQRKWLELVAGSRDGQRENLLPAKISRWMESAGYVERIVPHNPTNYERLVINSAGRKALAAFAK